MFNSNNFNEIPFLNFSDDFEISLNSNNKIIFAPNGTGKTQLYKNIKSHHPDYAFIDYDELKQVIIANKKNIYIGANINALEELEKQKNDIVSSMDIKSKLKDVDIKLKGDAQKVFPSFISRFSNYHEAIVNFNEDGISLISNQLDDIDKKFLRENLLSINLLNNLEDEIDRIKDEYKKRMFEQINIFMDDNDCMCPICDTVKEFPIKRMIAEKMGRLNAVENDLIKEYQSLNSISPSEIVNRMQNIKSFVSENEINEEKIMNFCLCGGNPTNMNQILRAKSQLIELSGQINSLEEEKTRFYEELKINMMSIKEFFKKHLKIEDEQIVFDDMAKLIHVKLSRDVSTYSTGEINLIVFMVYLYNFMGSDKAILVIDDPLSSYDLINQYKIVYELVSVISNNKKILAFTHNIDMINISNTQRSDAFKYNYIEKYNNNLSLLDVNIPEGDSIFNIENLLELANENPNRGYLELLVTKDNLPTNDPLHNVFHYDEPYNDIYNGYELSNDFLVNLIDELDEETLINDEFVNNSINKIIYMAALRVWIEKQFYIYHPDETSLIGKTLGRKIEYLFNTNNPRWAGPDTVTRKYLMSKKVMLNQNEHYKSQIIPFQYALNISLDDLKNEILDIKEKFGVELPVTE